MKKTITLFILLFTLSLGQMWGYNYLAGAQWGDWKCVDAYQFSADNKLELNLAANTDYTFKFVAGGVNWCSYDLQGEKITSTLVNKELDKIDVEKNDLVLHTGEEGTYIFQYSYFDNKHHLSIYFPQARLTKGSYLYVDARNTNWVDNNGVGFVARYQYKYYDSGTDISYDTCRTPLEYQVHYTIVPNNDYVGQVKIDRLKPDELTTTWDWSNNIAAYSRTSSKQNCLSMENATGGVWREFTPVWTTYCPIKKSTTINDNGTVTYGGNGSERTPYSVEKGTKIKVSATSEDYISDANMTTKYNFYKDSESQQDGTGTTYEFTASASAGTTHQINVNGYNYYNETASSNQFSTLLYYETVTCHTVTYITNSATSGSVPAATKYKSGDNVTVLGNTGSLIRDGYLFSGWNTKADGSGTHFDAGGTISGINKDTALYADWKTMVILYPTSGDFVNYELTSISDQNKALYIDKAYFADARPGNRIKIDGPDASVEDDAKFFFGDYYVNHVPGSDFRQVPTGSDVLPVYIYLTQEMIDYIQDNDLRIYGQNMTINRVELEVGRAGEFQPDSTIWMGEFTVNDLSTLELLIDQLDVNWSHYDNMIIYHNAGTKDYSFNVRTNWEESGIISYWKGNNHITQEKNFTVVDLKGSNAATVIGATPNRLFIQRDDHAEGEGVRTPFTITSIVLEKSNTATGSTWSGATWSQEHAPTTDECAVITEPMTVDVNHAIAGRVVIDQNGHTGQLTIQPNKGLDVRLTVKKTTDGSILETTSPADLVLESSSDGNASLIFENDENQATVQMYSKANIDGETWNWQFMGIPFTSANALYSYYDSYLYQWTNSGWAEVANGASMSPFTGYCITQDAATTYVMDGTLNPTTSHTFSVPAGVEMVFANSWTAPIYVGAITDEAFEITTKDIYLFNTGYKPEGSGGATANDGKDKYESGTYLTLPIHSAKYTGDSLIAPMQGFYVDNTAGSAGSITLSYDAVVRPSGTRNIAAGPMHAPKRTQAQQADNHPVVLKIWANGAVYNDRAVLLERSDFSTGFDNGWDGKKLSFGEVGPSVYVINTLGEPEAVSAIPDLEGTVVGFRAGTNNTCTMSFEYNGEDTFYLNDLQAQQSTQIASENSYTFTCTAGDNEARFVISATPIAKTPTDIGPGADSPSTLTRKILLNDHIYIIREGRMFSMDGRLVK